MKKIVLLLSIIIMLIGCSPKNYYISKSTAKLINDMIVDDTIKILRVQNITAKSTIFLDFEINNEFEKSLSNKLRLAGYAVKELDNKHTLNDTDIKLSYTVDYIEKSKKGEVIRLYLKINNDIYTKGYNFNIEKGLQELSLWSVNNVGQ